MANTNRSDLHEPFLQLVRLGIGTSKDARIPNGVDWLALKMLADEQGLTAIVLDGIDILNANLSNSTNTLPLEFKLEWIGEVLQDYEQRYVLYQKAIGSLAGFYNQHGFKMMVVKGYACNLDYPKPEHRPCGDIDIWQFGQQKKADKELVSWFKVQGTSAEIDSSHHHHTVFEWNDFTVENHYDFLNVHSHKTNRDLEKILKQLGEDDSFFVEVEGEKVYLPSPNLHALFLLRHAMAHFAATELKLRQVLDWGMFAHKHGKEVDWEWLEGVLDVYGMKQLYDVFNAICVEDLGFIAGIFPKVQYNPILKERVLNEILDPEIPNNKPHELFKRIKWKWHRWRANEWKHKLVYNESMWSSFWNGIWNHLLKPASI